MDLELIHGDPHVFVGCWVVFALSGTGSPSKSGFERQARQSGETLPGNVIDGHQEN